MNIIEIIEIAGKLLAAAFVALLAYLTPKAKEWLVARTGKDYYDQLMRLVASFARAAEQLYHAQDPEGTLRKRFVLDQLRALDVEITEVVLNMIEGAVWEINTENKKALVQTKELEAMANKLEEAAVQETLARFQGGGNGDS